MSNIVPKPLNNIYNIKFTDLVVKDIKIRVHLLMFYLKGSSSWPTTNLESVNNYILFASRCEVILMVQIDASYSPLLLEWGILDLFLSLFSLMMVLWGKICPITTLII